MTKRAVEVEIYIESLLAHTSQLYSGLAMLHDQGLIKVRYRQGNELRKDEPLVRMRVNGKWLLYDLSDNRVLYSSAWLEKSDHYFKRMLTRELQETDPRFHPYGLNYPVFHWHDRMVYRAWLTKDRQHWVNAFLRSNRLLSKWLNINLSYANNLVHHFEDIPRADRDPKIIFYARLWNPDTARQEWKKEERFQINQERVELVLRLRREFGDRFIGGIQRDPLSIRVSPEALVQREHEVYKGTYLKNLRGASIGIASPGLEGSVGFKMAEYVAMSKAVVTAPLNCVLPGDFDAGRNYYEYNTVDECVHYCSELVSDKMQRESMMEKNYHYYLDFLRPDKLVMKCIGSYLD